MAASKPIKLELLAPARDAETARAAIACGADAVYIGANAFGARSGATNDVDDIRSIVDYAHQFGVKVYVTVNTIIYDNELDNVRELICRLYKAGVDALIVQDMAITRLDIPPIELHASTQCNARTVESLTRLSLTGFSQLVLPREFSLEQIAEVAKAVPDTPLEAFVHGALCVSYSGDCQAGQVLANRSANRGECPQICRLKYTLTDQNGRAIENLPDGLPAERYWLSLADMNRIDELQAMADAGVRSFKIEGRLKSISYVKNVVSAYRKALDKVIELSEGKYIKASYGYVAHNFAPNPLLTFNRGYTKYFLRPGEDIKITSWMTPKFVGAPVAKVVSLNSQFLTVKATAEISNGDGLTWFDGTSLTGFRVNRVEHNRIYPAPGSVVPSLQGTQLYRNVDTHFDSMITRNDIAVRSIDVGFVLRHLPDNRIAVDVSDTRGCSATVTSTDVFVDKARTPQAQQRLNLMSRLGDTIYTLRTLDDRLDDLFVQSSVLVELRRMAIQSLERVWKIKYRLSGRKPSTLASDAFVGYTATYHDNISNELSREFYVSHGADVIQNALETDPPTGEVCVMTTRYCLRRSLGMCLKKQKDTLTEQLYLKAPVGMLRLSFDCNNCQMKIYTNQSKF